MLARVPIKAISLNQRLTCKQVHVWKVITLFGSELLQSALDFAYHHISKQVFYSLESLCESRPAIECSFLVGFRQIPASHTTCSLGSRIARSQSTEGCQARPRRHFIVFR